MKLLYQIWVVLLCCILSASLSAQELRDDSVCVALGDPITLNVLANDDIEPGTQVFPFLLDQSDCFRFGQGPDGNPTLQFIDPTNTSCCGDFILSYSIDGVDADPANIFVTIKCEKPDCNNVDLEPLLFQEFNPDDPTASCAAACAESEANYYVSSGYANSYLWSVTGGTLLSGQGTNSISIQWGSAGFGQINLQTPEGPETVCVELLEKPTASFTAASTVCLGNELSFDNTSTGGSSYFWDFGDGSFSTLANPTYSYSTAGTYEVTLVATKDNYAADGTALCCCTDTVTQLITVDPTPGPSIYWVSTLCAGSNSLYWTDATNCGTYDWAVFDEVGNPITFTGQGTDTISVTWGNGPTGTISLEVLNCDQSFCTEPTTVTVPIVSAIATIDGPTQVCLGDTEVYTVPKWQGTDYTWLVSNGTILSGQGSHSIIVQWFADPGDVLVNYQNEFLSGLPGQEGQLCEGSGNLAVSVKPEFAVLGPVPAQVCTGQSSSFSTNQAGSYSWSVSPAAALTPLGPNTAQIDWTVAGTYTVTATADDPAAFCNPTATYTVIVQELAVADSIIGPVEVCTGQPYTYTVQGGSPDVVNHWVIQNGSPATSIGPGVTVTWGTGGSNSISLVQQLASGPGCFSDTLSLNVTPLSLQGPLSLNLGDGCINATESYTLSPGQHADATYSWDIVPATAGSILSGQNSSTMTVQWNNDPGPVAITAKAYLCGDSLVVVDTINLILPVEPVITQTGNLCPGATVSLCVNTPDIVSYSWSTGATSACISPGTAGLYTVETVDINGCANVTAYILEDFPAPIANISSPDKRKICLNNANTAETVQIFAETNPNYTFDWFLNGSLQPAPSPNPDIFTHTEFGVAGTYNYTVVVTDITTGCTNTSSILPVTEEICVTDTACEAETYNLAINAVNQTPDCNVVDFTALGSSNLSYTSWWFGDGTVVGGSATTQHTYTQAGYFDVTVFARVPSIAPDDTCLVRADTSVCIPLAADYEYQVDCYNVFFTDFSTYLPLQDITSWFWDFGDGFGSTSTLQDPMHTYVTDGLYPVTLTVTNASGCQAVITKMIEVNGVQGAGLTLSPGPYCVGKPITFSGFGADVQSWLWNYDDGAFNGAQVNQHAYTSFGTYTISLEITNFYGCAQVLTTTFDVGAGPPQDSISASGPLTICDGESLTLTAPAGAGYTYLWNTGATTQQITVSAAGNYSVTVADADGCSYMTDPVTVTVEPLPDATVTGNTAICDAGCTELSVSQSPGATYQWFDNLGNPLLGQTNPIITVCDFSLLAGYYAEVTSLAGCTAASPIVVVQVVNLPIAGIDVQPDFCEGSLSTLQADPVQANVLYSWSTGATGTLITTGAAGSYTLTATDTLTGCSATATAIIHPAPDLCIMPAGCYEICNPDTLSAPAGLAQYQWFMNGMPITGATTDQLIVTQPGSYSLSATNDFGCTAISDSLYLEVIDCDSSSCDDLSASYTVQVDADGNTNACCGTISYINDGDLPLVGLQIRSDDTDLNIDLAGIDPALFNYGSGSNYINLVSSTGPALSTPIPTGGLADFIALCISNQTTPTQEVIIDWYDFDLEIVCSDTLVFNCPPEPDCLYQAADSVYCSGSEAVYELTICNPASNTFPINYVELSTSGLGLLPDQFSLASPLAPGSCTTITLQVDPAAMPGDSICYQLIGHDQDPNKVDSALCCSLETEYCFVVPDCDPCDDVEADIKLSNPDGCCYTLFLGNNYDANTFTGLGISMLSANTSMSLNNFFGSGWITNVNTPTYVELSPGSGTIPLGLSELPEICIDTEVAPEQYLLLQWLQGDSVVCEDTLVVRCEPPCGYVIKEELVCDPVTGELSYTFGLVNTADFTMTEAVIEFDDPAYAAGNQTVSLGSLLPGQDFGPITINFGVVPPGETCFTLSLHELGHNNSHLNCCNIRHCIEVPECKPGKGCLCDEDFKKGVSAGFSSIFSGLTGTFNQLQTGAFDVDCDSVIWKWGDGNATINASPGPVRYTFASEGEYEVCMVVQRNTPDGDFCEEVYCEFIAAKKPADGKEARPVLFPSPSKGRFSIRLDEQASGEVRVGILNAQGSQRVLRNQELSTNVLELDLSRLPKGVYLIFIETAGGQWVESITIE